MNGWEIKLACDVSYPPLSQYQPRKDDDNDKNQNLALWHEGTDPQIICSRRSFVRVRKEYIPYLKI